MAALARPPLYVVGLGGNAICPPRGDLSLATERALISEAMTEVARLAGTGVRLLIVHGNGPQVGRLLAAPGMGDPESLDIHVAQTQGELGYLVAAALDARLGAGACVALVTRVLVDAGDPAFAQPSKPIGAMVETRPAGVAAVRVAEGAGWRRVVASPRPLSVIEEGAIVRLIERHHVVAGGGGGVPLVDVRGRLEPRGAVVDKDWVAGLLARSLGAERLVFVTDVSHAFDGYGGASERPITAMSVGEARARLARGVFTPGSMGPKVESAADFAHATGRPAVITTPGALEAALAGAAGTTIIP